MSKTENILGILGYSDLKQKNQEKLGNRESPQKCDVVGKIHWRKCLIWSLLFLFLLKKGHFLLRILGFLAFLGFRHTQRYSLLADNLTKVLSNRSRFFRQPWIRLGGSFSLPTMQWVEMLKSVPSSLIMIWEHSSKIKYYHGGFFRLFVISFYFISVLVVRVHIADGVNFFPYKTVCLNALAKRI